MGGGGAAFAASGAGFSSEQRQLVADKFVKREEYTAADYEEDTMTEEEREKKRKQELIKTLSKVSIAMTVVAVYLFFTTLYDVTISGESKEREEKAEKMARQLHELKLKLEAERTAREAGVAPKE